MDKDLAMGIFIQLSSKCSNFESTRRVDCQEKFHETLY
jgi:hypothetical protein